jgi:hypothetical protein
VPTLKALVVVVSSLLLLAVAQAAGAARKPTKAENAAIRNGLASWLERPGNWATDAKVVRISSIRISSLTPTFSGPSICQGCGGQTWHSQMHFARVDVDVHWSEGGPIDHVTFAMLFDRFEPQWSVYDHDDQAGVGCKPPQFAGEELDKKSKSAYLRVARDLRYLFKLPDGKTSCNYQ